MGSEKIELNGSPLVLDGQGQYVTLQKDKKSICRASCSDFPFKVPTCWTICEFRPSSMYRESTLPRYQLYPQPENLHEKNEWPNFMTYLWKRAKVAVVKLRCCSFYLLAPDPEFTHVIALCKRKTPLAPVDQEMSDNNWEHSGSNLAEDHGRNYCKNVRFSGINGASAMLGDDVLGRCFVRTDPSYLRTLSQTHAAWAFGAIAELIDNSRDADATRLGISVEYLYSKKVGEKIPVLSVVDDGTGMSHQDIMRMLSFGHKQPDEETPDRIGRFGIGFKTGAMKLGKDVLVLSQTTGSRSVAFLSQSYNEDKENLEIPIIAYRKLGAFMEVDLSIQSEASANLKLNAIKEFSPFNEYLLGERLGLFGEMATGTQIYIWNLDKWSSDYSLQWEDSESMVEDGVRGDILIRSRRIRSRPGQISQEVPLDYSLQAYLEVIFLDPRMKIIVQGSSVKSRPLAKSLNKTSVVRGTIMGKDIHLTLGRSQIEWERMNGGVFLYWHGRLIEAYKRVGSMIHNADVGRGVLGVVDVSALMDDNKGNVWVLNNKQGFQDCEAYAKLEEWLGSKIDEYLDENFDKVDLKRGGEKCKPDHEWVQCDKCRKWRILSTGFDIDSLPPEWFCYMPPFNGACDDPEQQTARGVITIAAKRSRYDLKRLLKNEEVSPKAKSISPIMKQRHKQSDGQSPQTLKQACDDEGGDNSTETEDSVWHPELEKPRRGKRSKSTYKKF
ncbi:MORC family CW-type zinc finger protein 2B-like isoform X1 [Asparagus officinalis]|uniref:MORC family CW-type zinc finger protein 2B-like isoform X1 n=1 Tax=Asparagus officinalis TaxID=4686 RepID=UPI00098E3D99|nr:MORC family CW-type zinc finger protein 2B-like isoform X1 [Asparagus officinalis]XP_020271092.1 MORC family CW-type zinc finger protein 2B-like isoform X1 [Asparagus officinalis]